MKAIILLIVLFSLVGHTFSQDTTKARPKKEYHLQTSKTQSTIAWVLVASEPRLWLGNY